MVFSEPYDMESDLEMFSDKNVMDDLLTRLNRFIDLKDEIDDLKKTTDGLKDEFNSLQDQCFSLMSQAQINNITKNVTRQ